MKYIGFLDNASLYKFTGWAANTKDPSAHIEVEFVLDHIVIGRAVCNEFRSDLAKAGIGKGDHGFSHTFDPPLPALPASRIIARFAGTKEHLKNSPWPKPLVQGFALIAADIVDNCNLRCPFCLFDHSKVKHTNKMTKETFAKLIKLADHVNDGQFLLSCLHEPTLHPELTDFLEMIPENLRQKFSFTTNNCKRMTNNYIEHLANANLHRINISFDSLDPELFSVLRPGGNLQIFLDNTRLMAKAFRNNPRAPKLCFIIMAFKSNMDEIPELIRTCHEEFGAFEVQVHHTYNVTHIPSIFRSRHIMTKTDWDVFEQSLAAVTHHFILSRPPEDYSSVPAPDYYMQEDSGGFRSPMIPPSLPLELRVLWDGTILVLGREKYFHLNINTARDPYSALISL